MINLAYAQTSQPASGGNPLIGFLPIILIIVILYFLMILPQQRRQKKHNQMLTELKKGDRVVMSGGIYGIITNVKERTFMVKVAETTEVEIEKTSIAYKL
ncbi:MAG: preprotein translocase subunit YajC [Candidatus Latescibacteria bacterium]|nr:preprotein translocase subunit YajC [Candidatus Latescibacterota bacterium]